MAPKRSLSAPCRIGGGVKRAAIEDPSHGAQSSLCLREFKSIFDEVKELVRALEEDIERTGVGGTFGDWDVVLKMKYIRALAERMEAHVHCMEAHGEDIQRLLWR